MRKMSKAILGSLACTSIALSVLAAPSATAVDTALTAHYGSAAAKAVQRTPAFPTCSGSTFNPFTVSQAENPYAQATGGAVDLSTVVAGGAYLMLFETGNATYPWGIAMYPNSVASPSASDEMRFSTTSSSWVDSLSSEWTTAKHFTDLGKAYGLYSGGFLHDSSGGFGTFFLIGQTWPGADTLTYTPSAQQNSCIGNFAVPSTAGMGGTPPSSFTVTVNALTGGTVSSSAASVSSGGSVTISALPTSGYAFSAWSCTGVSSPSTATATLTNISANVDCTASFSASTAKNYGDSNKTDIPPQDRNRTDIGGSPKGKKT